MKMSFSLTLTGWRQWCESGRGEKTSPVPCKTSCTLLGFREEVFYQAATLTQVWGFSAYPCLCCFSGLLIRRNKSFGDVSSVFFLIYRQNDRSFFLVPEQLNPFTSNIKVYCAWISLSEGQNKWIWFRTDAAHALRSAVVLMINALTGLHDLFCLKWSQCKISNHKVIHSCCDLAKRQTRSWILTNHSLPSARNWLHYSTWQHQHHLSALISSCLPLCASASITEHIIGESREKATKHFDRFVCLSGCCEVSQMLHWLSSTMSQNITCDKMNSFASCFIFIHSAWLLLLGWAINPGIRVKKQKCNVPRGIQFILTACTDVLEKALQIPNSSTLQSFI